MRESSGNTERLGAPYAWFLVSGMSWYGTWGMQHVLFSWLVVGVLNADPARVGTAQMLMTLPALFLMPLAGSLADRFGRRRSLVGVHLAGCFAAAFMAWLVGSGELSLFLLFCSAPVWGAAHSFQYPAREAILFEVGNAELSRAAAGTTLAQFLFQAGGNALAGLASQFGATPLLVGQSLLAASGLLALPKLPRSELHQPAGNELAGPANLLEGLRVVLRSPLLRTLAILTTGNGLLFLGPYFVAGPVIVRDVYGGGAGEIALFFMMFPLGTAASASILFALGDVQRRVALLLAGLSLASLCLLGIGTRPPFGVMLGLVFVWGCAGGLFITMNRTLFLQAAPSSHRARVLSVQGMALLGSAPFSNLATGWIAEAVGAPTAMMLAGTAMLLLVGLSAIHIRKAGLGEPA